MQAQIGIPHVQRPLTANGLQSRMGCHLCTHIPRREVQQTAVNLRPVLQAYAAAPAAPAPTTTAAGLTAVSNLESAVQPPLSFVHRHGMYDTSGRLMLKNLTLTELEEWCVSVGELPRRAKQLAKALYGQGRWIRSLDDVDGDSAAAFSAAFKAKVAATANISGGLQLQSAHTARDGTHKLVFSLVGEEGGATGTVETVLIPMTNRQGGQPRYTACLSTQVGCAMNCQFCYTGRMGLLGNLNTAQVVEQVVQARRWLAEQAAIATAQQQQGTDDSASHTQGQAVWHAAALASGQQQAHIDAGADPLQSAHDDSDGHSSSQGSEQQGLQGEGEVVGALSLLANELPSEGNVSGSSQGQSSGPAPVMRGLMKDKKGGYKPWPIANIVFMGMGEPLHNYDTVVSAIDILAECLEFSRSKIIVSTVGLADAMATFLASNKAKLALSLHATTDAVRDWIVPTNRRYPISSLTSVLKQHFPAGTKGDKFVVIEYVMLDGVNDTIEDAHRLVELTSDIYCMINLIVFNPHDGTPFKKSNDDAVHAFRGVLLAAGRVCTVRVSKGDDEMAACGQLGDPGQAKKPVPVAVPSAFKELLSGAAAIQQQQQQAATMP